jgi:hypothetical protein
VEPLHFAARIGAERCLMINAAHDEIIPRATTDALRAAIGNPPILWLPAGHYSAVTYFITMQQRAMDFLKDSNLTTGSSDPSDEPSPETGARDAGTPNR